MRTWKPHLIMSSQPLPRGQSSRANIHREHIITYCLCHTKAGAEGGGWWSTLNTFAQGAESCLSFQRLTNPCPVHDTEASCCHWSTLRRSYIWNIRGRRTTRFLKCDPAYVWVCVVFIKFPLGIKLPCHMTWVSLHSLSYGQILFKVTKAQHSPLENVQTWTGKPVQGLLKLDLTWLDILPDHFFHVKPLM